MEELKQQLIISILELRDDKVSGTLESFEPYANAIALIKRYDKEIADIKNASNVEKELLASVLRMCLDYLSDPNFTDWAGSRNLRRLIINSLNSCGLD